MLGFGLFVTCIALSPVLGTRVGLARSNEVWFVQAYDPNDGSCKSFATGWEDASHACLAHCRTRGYSAGKIQDRVYVPLKSSYS